MVEVVLLVRFCCFKLFFELLRGDFKVFFIQSVKIGVVMKPYHKAGLSDGALASDEIVANV